MKRLFLFLAIFILTTGLFAQKLGYIRTDTAYVSVFIYTQSEVRSSRVCKYSLSDNSKILSNGPGELLAYGYDKKDFYSFSVKPGDDSVKLFLLAIVQGDMPVYYLKERHGKHFYISGGNNQLIELRKKGGKYKQQLAAYFGVSSDIIPHIHNSYSRQGIKRTAAIMKAAGLESGNLEADDESGRKKDRQHARIMDKPMPGISLQSGFTVQRLPLVLPEGLPASWGSFNAISITYSLGADIPLLKYWTLTYHQEVVFNKFVNNNKQGSSPPDVQLIQDYSVLGLPAMLRYTFGMRDTKFFINAGFQLDISLNKKNMGWMIIDGNEGIASGVRINYIDYSVFQPGVTAGFGLNHSFKNRLGFSSELRYSRISKVMDGMPGTESLLGITAGFTYHIAGKGNRP